MEFSDKTLLMGTYILIGVLVWPVFKLVRWILRSIKDEFIYFIRRRIHLETNERFEMLAKSPTEKIDRLHKLIWGALRASEMHSENQPEISAKCWISDHSPNEISWTYDTKSELENQGNGRKWTRYPAGDRYERGPFGSSQYEVPNWNVSKDAGKHGGGTK